MKHLIWLCLVLSLFASYATASSYQVAQSRIQQWQSAAAPLPSLRATYLNRLQAERQARASGDADATRAARQATQQAEANYSAARVVERQARNAASRAISQYQSNASIQTFSVRGGTREEVQQAHDAHSQAIRLGFQFNRMVSQVSVGFGLIERWTGS